MTNQHYALIRKQGCTPLEFTFRKPSTSTPANHISNSTKKEQSEFEKEKSLTVRAELEEIYQKYAEMYPNPRLLEEKRHRDTLLQAAGAASTFQQQHVSRNVKEKTKSRRGFFTFLFGSRESSEMAADSKLNVNGDTNDKYENDMIQYSELLNEHDDGSLCGTLKSLDKSCIPPEVYNVVRSHLTSTRTRRDNPNSLRWGARSRMLKRQQLESNSSLMFIVVGLGEIAEFGGNLKNSKSKSSSRILRTSDRDELSGYAERTEQFDLSTVRGTVLSQNCVAISWGFLDGITVFYRRKISVSNDSNEETDREGWEAVWWVGPSEPVLENLTSGGQDLFHDDIEQPGSTLLKISDCVSLHVEVPVTSGEEQSLRRETSTVATLVLSRSGGYIELIPLPTALWNGPILKREVMSSSKTRGQRLRQHHHYTAGQKIVSPLNTLALTTFDYHLDIQALEVYRTNVDSETIWNDDLYPDGPPAEFLLVASGVSVDGGYGETITFWAISTLFASNEELLATPSNNSQSNIDFKIHSSLLEAIWTSTGAPISTFATPGIMSRWRTARQVELKETTFCNGVTEEYQDSNSSPKPLAPVTTLSTTAPIVSMAFSNCDKSSPLMCETGPFLSILDWNGGVQIFDCSTIARLAAQNLTQHEYEQYHGTCNESEEENAQMVFHLVKCVVLRSQIGSTLRNFEQMPMVSNLHWLEAIDVQTGGVLPSVIFILSRSRKLVVVTFKLPENHITERLVEEALTSTIVSVPFPASGASIESFEDNCLSFLSLQIGTSKSSSKLSTHLMKYFVMEQLHPVAIVEKLARESKFQEAIQAAGKLSKCEQNKLTEVVFSCRRRLWETKRDINSLIATDDELYILGEVEAICKFEVKDLGLSSTNLRSLLKLSLELVSNHHDKQERLRNTFVRLGTFELLCRYYESKFSLEQFRKEFLKTNLMDLSFELAKRGDVPALSIVLFRHRFELHEKLFDILGSIPLALKSSSFCHLIPVVRNQNLADLFLHANEEYISELPWSHMPQYVLEKHMVSIAFDRFDEIVVLEYNMRSIDEIKGKESLTSLVIDWCVERAKQMQTFIGNIDDLVSFAQVGMKCVCMNIGKSKLDIGVSPCQELHMIWRTALSLKRMLLDRVISIDGDGINTDDLIGMGLVQLLDLVLDCGVQSNIVRYRFDEYIQPLVIEMCISNSSDDLDEALSTCCLKEAKSCSGLHATGAKQALAYAIAISENSKTSLRKKKRLIKNEINLIFMALGVTDESLKNLETVKVSMSERREIIESVWSLYETLPAQLKTPESEIEIKLQRFYDDLVGTDILSRWPECNPFDFFNSRRSRKHEEAVHQDDDGVILQICESFISAITVIANSQDQVSLLQDLLIDTQSFNEVVLKNSVNLSTKLCQCLIPEFLERGYFGLVASYLGSDENVVDRSHVLRNVIEYVDEAMFSEGDNRNRIINAMKCQDALEPLFPEIQSLFVSNRRYLDASHFITTILLDGKLATPFTPSDLKEMAPLDVLETILREFPECIGCRCPQWMDTKYAEDANKLLRQAEASSGFSTEGHENDELPDLPGGAVFHLATILGLESRMSALFVKSRVIQFALRSKFYGAGAAIARTLLNEQQFGSGANMDAEAMKLNAIADVVSIEDYLDHCTRKELCETVLRRLDDKVFVENFESYSMIVQVSTKLDYITSRFDHKSGVFSRKRKECLLSRPIARVHFHTFHEYKRDIHSLFKDLGTQSSEGLVHDSLMDNLCRFIFYWCIHESITMKSSLDLRYKADTQDILKLACGILLQTPSILTAEKSVCELQEIARAQSQKIVAEERFEASNILFMPNPEVLKHLIDRGFSENAARRAVSMTGNSGHNEAMAWAFEHAMDPELNNPLIILKSTNLKLIDEDSIQVLQRSLVQLSDIIRNPLSRSVFLNSVTNIFQNSKASDCFSCTSSNRNETNSTERIVLTSKPLSKSEQEQTRDNADKPSGISNVFEEIESNPGSAAFEENMMLKQSSQQQRRSPPPPPPRVFSHTTTNSISRSIDIESKEFMTNNETKLNRNDSTTVSCATTIARKEANTSMNSTICRKELKKRGKAALDKLKRGGPTSGIGTTAERTPTGAKSTVGKEESRIGRRAKLNNSDIKQETEIQPHRMMKISSRTTINREELRKRGHAALKKLRSTANEPESRRRLAKEGHQLLKQSKIRTPRLSLATDQTEPSTHNSRIIRSGLSVTSSSKETLRSRKTNAASASPVVVKNHTNDKPESTAPSIIPSRVDVGNIGKVMKIDTNNSNEDDDGWDFDDFDSF